MNETSDSRSQGAVETLDLCGLRCPMPLLKVRQRLRGVQDAQMLRVLASDPGARRDIPAWLGQTPHRLVHMVEREGVIEFMIMSAGEH